MMRLLSGATRSWTTRLDSSMEDTVSSVFNHEPGHGQRDWTFLWRIQKVQYLIINQVMDNETGLFCGGYSKFSI
jgi:hypothetical protein